MIRTAMLAAALMSSAALAQTQSADPGTPRTPLPIDRGYDKPQARTEAINAPNRAEVAATNNAAAAVATDRADSVNAANASAQAAYDYDMSVYVDRLRARDAKAVANEATYAKNQRAYADAMRAWRIQVYDCNRGVIAACRAPTPEPAAFW